MKIHLDTDIGGDMDDLCALALLLRWPGVEMTGITTTAEAHGRRAGYVRYVLNLTGRGDIPFAAGADLSEGYTRYESLGYPPEEENWPEYVPPHDGPTEAAVELLRRSIEQGAVIAAIGPYTNLMLLDRAHPGILKRANVVLMGGNVYPPPPGFPQWPNEDDWNVQVDVPAAQHVIEQARPLLVPVSMTCQTALRRSDLPRLAQAGKLGELLVRQAQVFDRTEGFAQRYGAVCAGLPDDLINFHHDPLACAIALGWNEGVVIEEVALRLEVRDGWLYEIPDPDGVPVRLVTQIDAGAFNAFWAAVVGG
jgi:purine nucleosidase